MKKNRFLSLATLMLGAFLFASCVDGAANDGSEAETRLTKGYKPKSAGGTAPFKSVTGASIQIWENTFEFADSDSSDEVCIKILKTPGWWGGAYGCYDQGATAGKYDLSKVRSVTFQAKASSSCTVVFGLITNEWGYDDTGKEGWLSSKKEIDIATEYKTKEIKLDEDKTLSDDIDTLFQFMNGSIGANEYLYIKDFAFFDANGEEIVPTPKE